MKKEICLKLTNPPMRGPAVMRATEVLSDLNFLKAPKDVFDVAVQDAVILFQLSQKLKIDGIIGPITTGRLFAFTDTPVSNPFPGKVIVGQHSNPRWYKGSRPWRNIRGVTLHQTGCLMGRWGGLNAHVAVTQDATLILVNSPADFIWHAQGLSGSTIGIEVEGNFEGVKGKPKTLWAPGGGPHHLSQKHKTAFKLLGEWLAKEFETNGQVWETCHAHRQSFASRFHDPGSEIWQAAALPWIKKYNLETQYQGLDAIGTGSPIPKTWQKG